MVNSPQLSAEVLQSIAAQISERTSSKSELVAPGAIAGLGESLRVSILTQEQINEGSGPLAERILETGQWHHQIYVNDVATSFARSVEAFDSPGTPSEVVEVADADIANDIRRTIEWIDKNVDMEAEAEVLIAPSHFLTCLWLHGPGIDAVVVSSAPKELRGVVPNELISGEDLLSVLASVPAIEGLGMPEDSSAQFGEDA